MLCSLLNAAMNSREGSEMTVDVTTFVPIAVWVQLFCSSKLHDGGRTGHGCLRPVTSIMSCIPT